MTAWVRTYENGANYLEHLGGVAWTERKPPPWLHRCRPQMRGWFDGHYAERCRCGAYRDAPHGPWVSRNETRRGRRRERREAKMPREQVTCRDCGKPYEAITGSRDAQERLCSSCWAERFVRTGRL